MLNLDSDYRNPVAALERRFLQDETSQTRVEYVMLIALAVLAVFVLTPNSKDAVLKAGKG